MAEDGAGSRGAGKPRVNDLTIAAVVIPPEADPRNPDTAADLRDCHAPRDEHHLAVWGNLDRCETFREGLEFWRGSAYEERLLFLARLDGAPVGSCSVVLPLKENTATAWIEVLVAAGYRRRGMGRRLLEFAEATARERGRTVFDGYCEEPATDEPGPAGMLPAKSGAGGIPLAAASTRFAAAAGYQLEQVEKSSRLGLSVDEGLLGRLESGASERSRDYRLVEWRNSCPDELVGAYAELKSRMSADVPTAGMEAEVEDWDAERVRNEEQSRARSGVESLVAAARHAGTGELAAYTVLTRRRDRQRTLNQEDTLVAGPHRGHRLGLLTKIANIRRAQDVWPEAQSVITWNASENRHMLAINISLGFKPAGFEGEWQKRLE